MARVQSLGFKIDELAKLEAQHKALVKQAKDLDAAITEMEKELILLLTKEGVSKSTGRLASVTLSDSVVPNVTDWDAFYAFIHKKKYFHLLERRASVTGCRELFTLSKVIPGVVPFTKPKLTLTLNKE